MHQAAEEILGGVKREVEVQYVVPVQGSMGKHICSSGENKLRVRVHQKWEWSAIINSCSVKFYLDVDEI